MNLEPQATVSSSNPATPKLSDRTLIPLSQYIQELRPLLPTSYFEPQPLRLGYFLLFGGIIALSSIVILSPTFWLLKLLCGLLIGFAFGGLGFLSHEISHGSIVKNTSLQNVLSFFGFAPFLISPTFWRAWHNKLHHGKTQQAIFDPDAFPTMKIYKHSKFIQFMFPFTPGSGHKRSYSYLFFWFSFHALVAQFYLRFRNAVYKDVDNTRVTIELALQLGLWVTALTLAVLKIGPLAIVWFWLIPLFAQNYYALSYIATNHNISPLTRVNDPLENSLTVTNYPVLEFLHLNFGYHVEHHIFPSVSGRFTKDIHKVLKQKYPETFKVMPKWAALRQLYSTPRIYKDSKTLIHPETQQTSPTL